MPVVRLLKGGRLLLRGLKWTAKGNQPIVVRKTILRHRSCRFRRCFNRTGTRNARLPLVNWRVVPFKHEKPQGAKRPKYRPKRTNGNKTATTRDSKPHLSASQSLQFLLYRGLKRALKGQGSLTAHLLGAWSTCMTTKA